VNSKDETRAFFQNAYPGVIVLQINQRESDEERLAFADSVLPQPFAVQAPNKK